MDYRDALELLSSCGLGAILATDDYRILEVNRSGERLLHAEEPLRGKSVRVVAPFLLGGDGTIGNPAFDQYLLPCPVPAAKSLPPKTRLYVFRDATKDVRHDILEEIFNQVGEAIAVWDGSLRLLMLNAAASKLEAEVIDDISGQYINDLYKAGEDSVLAIPMVVENKKPVRNLRQNYLTPLGKELQIVSNSFPILRQDKVMAAVCMMDDWTKMEQLNARVIELQRMLVGMKPGSKAKKNSRLTARFTFDDIVFRSTAMADTIMKCRRVSESDSSVLLYGETGTGKELFAQSIHNASRRATRPFIAINCAAIPDTLLESMLFGTEKGAYTGAERREGLFEQANTGTLLLDEINSMNIALQSKLLRVLQDGMIRRVGGTDTIRVDVRVISNTCVAPEQAIRQNMLRQDLYYRLGVVNITIPPLRDRKEDIKLLAKTFIAACNQKLRKKVQGIVPDALQMLYAYGWPGNVRELEHAIEYAMNMLPDEATIIASEYIPDHIQKAVHGASNSMAENATALSMDEVMEEAGRQFVRKMLAENGGNISRTARALGITRQNLQHRMKKLGMK